MVKKKQPSFESSLIELEEIVSTLEEGSISLEEALLQFEKGIKISESCQKTLNEAEQRIQILLKNNLKTFESE